MRIGPLDPPPVLPPAARPARAGFGAALSRALASVEGLQQQGDQNAERLARGAGNLHETALALEKADVAMRVAVKVRNRFVDAYQEIMRMPV
jgi:flagellar hook-basal body complex protein FliE